MEVIDAEACSIFEARGGGNPGKGIYLKATTDKNIRDRIGTKIYDLDFNSITGFVAVTGKPTIVYDVEQVHKIIPEIKSMSKELLEHTDSPNHKSYIAVPIPIGKQNFDDRNNSSLILRCINKKKTSNGSLTGLFSMDDKHLINYVALIVEIFNKVLKVLYERNDLIDLLIHEIENPIVSIRGKIAVLTNDSLNERLSDRKLNQKLKDIEEMASLLKGWSSNMVHLNQLMQGHQLSPDREWVDLWNEIIEDVIIWMSPVFKVLFQKLWVRSWRKGQIIL